MSNRRRYYSDPFTDLLFNALLGFTFLFLVAIMFMNPEAKSGIIDPTAEYIFTVTWEDNNPERPDGARRYEGHLRCRDRSGRVESSV